MNDSDKGERKSSTPVMKINEMNQDNSLFHQQIFQLSQTSLRDIERSVSPCEVTVTNPTNVDTGSKIGQSNDSINESPLINGRTGDTKLEIPYFIDVIDGQIDLRLASSNNPTAVMELDLEGNIRYLSKNWETIVGTSIKKILNKPIANIIIGHNDEDLKVFNNAIEKMIKDDGSYKVKFITATNDRSTKNESHSSGRITPNNSVEDLNANIEPAIDNIRSSPIEDDQSSTISSKLSNDGDVIELEAQGILVHDSKTKLPTRSMWIIKPFIQVDLDLTLPEKLINLLGFGAEIFEGYLLNLKELGIIDEESVPQPKTILCRICETHIPAWFIEKHSDLCIVEHRVNEDLQNCHDAINDQKDLIYKISDSLMLNYSSMSSSSSSISSSGSNSSNSSNSNLILDYKGIPLPNIVESSPRLASQSIHKNLSQSILQTKKFPFGILQRLIELCDEALLINPADADSEGEFKFSPDSEKAINSIVNWKVFETSDLAIRTLVEDTQKLVNEKIETVTILISILQYSEKIKKEVDELVLKTVRETVSKIKEQTMVNELICFDNNDKESMESNDQTLSEPVNLASNIIYSPLPSRNRSPPDIFKEEFFKDDIRSVTPKDILLRGRTQIPRSSMSGSSSDTISRNISKDLIDAFHDLELSKKSSENLSNNSSFSSPRRHLSPAPYVEKQCLSLFQRNTNTRFETNTPNSSPSIHNADNNDNFILEKRSSSGGMNSHSNKSSISKPPLSPLLVSSTPTSKPSSGGIRDYEVLKPISKGAFGSVFLAKRKLTGDYVAIKCLKKRDMIAKNQILNVKSERAVMMRQTDSPYVAQLYNSFQSKDYLYLVMEYLNGGDCATLLKTLGTLGDEWAKRYIGEVIVGVDDLHKRGIIHRDLKPDNLLIDSRGHLKLTDFGLSRMGVVRRQARGQRKSSTSEQAIEIFRKGASQLSTQSPLANISGLGLGNDSPSAEYNHKRTSSVTPFSLSPTVEQTKLSNIGASSITSPMISYIDNFNQQQPPPPSNRSSSFFKGRSGSNSSGLDSPLIKPILPRTSSESSFAIVDDDFQVSPSQNNPMSYALFDPSNEGEIKKFVGTPDYLAPETIKGVGQSEASDWWSLGCILFEFLFGYPPFHADTPEKVFKNILSGEIDWPPLTEEEERKFCSSESKDLIKKLLNLSPEERLGYNGADEIKQHVYFNGINWDSLFEEEASFIPKLDDPESTDYFDSRGADISQFPKEDSDSDENQDVSANATELGSPAAVNSPSLAAPGTVKRERRGSRLADPSEFGSFNFRNLNVLEKANKDVINRLKNEHLEHRNSFSSSSSDSTPLSRSRGYSFNGSSNNSPFKRPVSPVATLNYRSSSPNKDLSSMQSFKHERGGSAVSVSSSGDEFSSEKVSPSSETVNSKQRSSNSSLTKQMFKPVDFSPSSSDTEDSKALLRVRKRRESSRRIGSFSSNSDIIKSNITELDILYCEPIPIVRHSVSKLLEKCGCIVVSVSDGDELIRRATSQVKFDLIFTALRLSKVEAIDAVKLIKFTTGVNSNTPIIALTAFKDEAEYSKVFDYTIEKPVELNQLQKCINKFIKFNNEAIESDNDIK